LQPEELPLRSELFSVSQLELHAKTMAGLHHGATSTGRSHDRLLPRLDDNQEVLADAYSVATEAVKRGRRVTPAAEWFLDNYHLIEEQIRTARRHLPKRYSRELPRLARGPSSGQPRVYAIALELIAHADGRIDAESLRAFVAAYQSVTPLRLGELWAIPIMLRLALLENLRRVAVRIASARRQRDQAEFWVEQMLDVATREPAKVVLVLANMVAENPPLTNPFVAEFASRLQGHGPALVFAVTWLEQRLAEQGQTIEQVFQLASQSQAADQVSIGNSISSLRFLSAMDWRDFVEEMSVVERALHADPSHIYRAMDFVTRDRYRHAIERIARHSTLSEEDVARKAIELASSGKGRPQEHRRTHVGYFLIDKGRRQLERAVGMRQSLRLIIRRVSKRFPLTAYVGSIVILTALLTAGVLWWASGLGISAAGLTGLGILLAVAASQLAIAFVHWGTMFLAHPHVLPRMDFSKGLPAEYATAVAIPTLLIDTEDIDELIESLEVRFLANPDPNLSFALLTDFRDAASETTPEDAALLEHAKSGIDALNARYGPHDFSHEDQSVTHGDADAWVDRDPHAGAEVHTNGHRSDGNP
jgi:hypothetical protein